MVQNKRDPKVSYKQFIAENLITGEQLRGFARVSTDGFQLKLQVPDLSESLPELGVQLAVLVTKSGNLL